ncbi:MAG: bifunctional diaminohydroxyphosphoribosylaminopyrimidine deaminase/5-amino-6-(5-phosphoribosylamino)uracil reductase RibD [Ignavibacteriaceae bacterium]|nr:bifunctional diaminohydroxyphosphoribosylaminopyrimidine deaminase/5-amino-6-(5-phosphoribosylamino)uracil reductase RibD [Ignavibacteriaceae bacterium]
MTDETYIRIAISLAEKGIGLVSPNPMVGSIIVNGNQIVGAGYHQKYGESHAEVNAIKNAGDKCEGATLFCTLEPCNHTGKTPPCTEAIIKSGIKKVVIGSVDPNPVVKGGGAEFLRNAGVEVVTGVLEKECVEMNKFFFKHIKTGMPYITLKVAQTIDSKIADSNGDSMWITSLESRKYVHKMRSEYDAVMVGIGTVMKDNPLLNVRLVHGRDPVKVVLDSELKINLTQKILFQNPEKVLLLTSKESKTKIEKIKALKGLGVDIKFVKSDKTGFLDIKEIFKILGKLNISSVLVEGGKGVNSTIIRNKLFDELIVFIAPKLLGEGLVTFSDLGISSLKKAMKLSVTNLEQIENDIVIHYKR